MSIVVKNTTVKKVLMVIKVKDSLKKTISNITTGTIAKQDTIVLPVLLRLLKWNVQRVITVLIILHLQPPAMQVQFVPQLRIQLPVIVAQLAHGAEQSLLLVRTVH